MTLTRRRLLAAGLAAGTTVLLEPLARRLAAEAAATAPAGSTLTDVEHVVILIQENRSFDHYLGSLRGVRGFDDHPAGDRSVFAQPWRPGRPLLPFHFDTAHTDAACTNDVTHEWGPQHEYWNGGRMDGFVRTHVRPDVDGAAYGTACMGYYTRADLPFLYALADAFTVCDRYHCSLFGPTYPNRLYSLTGTIDPHGKAGGPVVTNPGAGAADLSGIWSWETMPERLQQAGVSWKIYNQLASNNNVLSLFKAYTNESSPLFRNALLPLFPGDFEADVAAGTLPKVSWVLSPTYLDEHPPAPPELGQWVTAHVLSTLVSKPEVWARTVLFVTYDENGGFFDHVPPPTPPPGTPGEYLTTKPLPAASAGIAGPIGLGFRVPALVVSPFSRGGLLCSETFDHTSLLRFLETRFRVEAPNLSAWRRATVGDLTSTLNLVSRPDPSVPALPQPSPVDPKMLSECAPSVVQGQVAGNLFPIPVIGEPPAYPVPTHQQMPRQEQGPPRHRPSGSRR